MNGGRIVLVYPTICRSHLTVKEVRFVMSLTKIELNLDNNPPRPNMYECSQKTIQSER